MKLTAVLLALGALVGCAKPARISTALTFGTQTGDLTTISLKIKNLEARATTPLLVDVTVGTASLIHPSAFVLNRNEEQILRATAKLPAGPLQATVTVKELESGKVLTTQRIERN